MRAQARRAAMKKPSPNPANGRQKTGGYRVFDSHSGDDIWVAEQIARCIEDHAATTFLDRRDIAAGDAFKDRIREEMQRCNEVLALFTPWSRRRAWVRHEIGMADVLRLRIVCVFYKVTIDDFRNDEDGLGPLDNLNIIDINALGGYFKALAKRTRSRMPTVFLSYGTRDKSSAALVRRALTALKISVFDSGSDVKAGENWRDVIQRAIRAVDLVVVVVESTDGAASSWVSYEIGMAEALRKPVVILASHNFAPSDMPDDLAAYRVLSFDPRDMDLAARDIARQFLASV